MSLLRPPPDPEDRITTLLGRMSAQRTAGEGVPVNETPAAGTSGSRVEEERPEAEDRARWGSGHRASPAPGLHEPGLHEPGLHAPGPEHSDSVGDTQEPVAGGEWLPPVPSGRHRSGAPERPRLLTLPAALRTVDLSVRPAAVLGVVLLVLVAVAVFGVRWWHSERAAEPVSLDQVAGQAAGHGIPGVPAETAESNGSEVTGAQAEGTGAAGAPDAAVASVVPDQTSMGEGSVVPGPAEAGQDAHPSSVVVHVAGAVRQPGVVQVPAGSRVQDAVDAAGGLTGQADTARVNLARQVVDGERLWVPHPGEEIPELPEDPGPPVPPGDSGSPGVAGGPADTGAEQGPMVRLNTADRQELESLPGVGPVTAGAILDWRSEHGGFTTVEELLEISGIGEATLEKLRPHVQL